MADQTPERLRQQVYELLEAAANTDCGRKKQAFASRAFALAQEAEAVERIQQETAEAG